MDSSDNSESLSMTAYALLKLVHVLAVLRGWAVLKPTL
jgi:hypothetical protein